jgi:glycosyltransferase involved in cell wall biosynthesis
VTAGEFQMKPARDLRNGGVTAARPAPARVAVFLQDLYGGGAERVMLTLAAGLSARGVQVDLVLIRREGAYAAEIPDGMRVVELGTGRMVQSIAALTRYLWRARPDAMLTALVHVNVGALLAAAAAPRRTRVVVTEHNQISRNYANLGSRTLKAAYALVRHLYPRAAAVVAVSSGVADDLSRFSGIGRDRIRVIHNPIVTPDLASRAAEAPDDPRLAPWFREGEPPVFVGVGRLSAQKDFGTLLRAFAQLRAGRPARLVVLGEGEERGALEKLAADLGIAEDVRLPGFVSNPYAYMAHADGFVLSSRFEGLPTVLVEAMACGTPVAATDCPSGPREILEEGRLGPLAPVGDAEALSRAMTDLLERPVSSETLEARAADFKVGRAVDRYLELLLEARA